MATATPTRIEVDLDPLASDEIDELARTMATNRATVIHEAIESYLEVVRWQSERIRQGIRDADAGKFASEEEVAEIFRRYR